MFYDIFDYMSDEEKEALKNSKRIDMSGEPSTFPKKASLAMAYVPWQQNCNMYENLDEAFRVGTIFPVLNKPFKGGEKCR